MYVNEMISASFALRRYRVNPDSVHRLVIQQSQDMDSAFVTMMIFDGYGEVRKTYIGLVCLINDDN